MIICGGRSQRMGRPKALLPWRGRPLVHHVASVLREVVEEIVIVTSSELSISPPPIDGVRIVRDRAPGLGPLGAIREGLHAARARLIYATGADAPFLTAAFVRALLDLDAPAAVDARGFVQSLAAVYPASAAGVADRLIAEGRMRPLFLLEALQYRAVPPPALPDDGALYSCNTPQEYLDALRRDGAVGPVTIEFRGRARELAGVDACVGDAGLVRELLADVDARHPVLELRCHGALSPRYELSVDGSLPIHGGEVPIAPGERLVLELAPD